MRNNGNISGRKCFTPLDAVIILFFAAAAVIIVIIKSMPSGDSLELTVRKNSAIIYSARLVDADDELICIDEEYNVYLLIESDGVSVISSDCPDKVCVGTGKITRAGQSIVCLPSHISVELKGSETELDGVVG